MRPSNESRKAQSFNERTGQTVPSYGYGTAVTMVEERNKVLRNTYWLAALEPGSHRAGCLDWRVHRSPANGGLGLIVFLGGAFAFMYAIQKTKDSAAGVGVLLAFTFFMGLMLSRLLAMVLGMKNGTGVVMTAFGGTAAVFFVMATLATFIKRDLSGMGKWLFAGALVIVVGAVINVFIGSTVGVLVISTRRSASSACTCCTT